MIKVDSELKNFVLIFVEKRPGQYSAISAPALAGEASNFFHRKIPANEIRQAVHDLRMAGNPICSISSGYFWPQTIGDVNSTIFIKFLAPAKSELLLASRMKEGARRYFGDQSPMPNFQDLYLAVSDSTGSKVKI